MKTTLSIEESDRLIELGVDPKLATLSLITNERRFTLLDILSILPKEIEYDGLTYGLNIWVDSAVWHVEYCAEKGVYDFLVDSNIEAPELIDALYQLLIWCLTEKKINLNTDKK